MPEDPCARAAHPCCGQFPRSAAGGTAAGAAAAPDREWPATTLNPRIHCEFTAVAPTGRNGFLPIPLAGRPSSHTCGTSGMEPADIARSRGYGQGQARQPAASGNRDVKPGLWYSRRPHRLHHPALRPCDIPRHLQKVHVLHTGESDAGRAGSFWLPARPLLNCPSRRSTAISQTGRVGTPGSPASSLTAQPVRGCQVQYGGAQPTPLRRTRIGT